MAHYSTEPEDRILVKGCGYLSFAKKISKTVGKNKRSLPQNSSETVESETDNIAFDRELQKQRYASPEKRHSINFTITKNNKFVRQYTKSTI